MPVPDIPAVTAEQMRLVDDLAVNQFHLKLIQMMENAGRNLAELARQQILSNNLNNRTVLVLAGPGGNGGGGLVAARRLHNWGARPLVQCAVPADQFTPIPAHQLAGLRAAGVSIKSADEPIAVEPDLIIDALLGYSIKGAPRPPLDNMIRAANASAAPIIALDLPSGLTPDSGQPQPPTIRATFTLTLALPKLGLLQEAARDYVGDLWLADISIPWALYQQANLDVPRGLFAQSELIHL